MRVIGQFRDIGDPNRFVWLRGFPDMPSREKALSRLLYSRSGLEVIFWGRSIEDDRQHGRTAAAPCSSGFRLLT